MNGTDPGRPSGARIYDVLHRTTYRYDDQVDVSYGRAHLIPRHGDGQRRLSSAVEINPEPAEVREHTDFFANRSLYFAVTAAHTSLAVTARSRVAVQRAVPDRAALDGLPAPALWERPADGADPGDTGEVGAEERATDAAEAAREARQFVLPSPMTGRSEQVTAFAAGLGGPQASLAQLLETLLDRVAEDFTYATGSTDLATTLPEVLERRQGVCQDFAHLCVAALRARGLPARYVSGYVETHPPPGRPKLVGADASHAWASVFAPGLGWVDLDPTNRKLVDDDYVVTAVGRDYSDVPPLRGVIFTESGTSTMTVAVDMTRVEPGAAEPTTPARVPAG